MQKYLIKAEKKHC